MELLNAGLDRSTLHVLNVTCCTPKHPKKESDMQRAVMCCRPAFLHQLQSIPPETPTLALGKWSAFSLLQRKKTGKLRGFINWAFTLPRSGK